MLFVTVHTEWTKTNANNVKKDLVLVVIVYLKGKQSALNVYVPLIALVSKDKEVNQ